MLTPYTDVTLWPTFDIGEVDDCEHFTLGFIVADHDKQPSWGGYYKMESYFYKDIIAKVRAKGGDVICSFGGAVGKELATVCKTSDELFEKYKKVILTYNFKSVDFDIEGSGSQNERANAMRADAILKLLNRFPDLEVSLTLPVSRYGLDNVMLDIVEITPCDVVNLMVMDYGTDTQDMGQAAIDAAKAARRQTGKCIGLTPMIGVNDTNEVFSLDDARKLKRFIDKSHWVIRTSFWSIERDRGKGLGKSLNWSSGIKQKPFEFTRIFK